MFQKLFYTVLIFAFSTLFLTGCGGASSDTNTTCNRGPFIISTIESETVQENTLYKSVTPEIVGEAVGDVTYSLFGVDSEQFILNTTTGVVIMESKSYNNPLDNNQDNIYDINLTATDSEGNSATMMWFITIEEVADGLGLIIKTDNEGLSSDTSFLIPTTGEGYNYNVDCDGDGIYEATAQEGNYTCEYTSAGTYSVEIEDNSQEGLGFPRIYFNNEGDKDKVVAITHWGEYIRWQSMERAFMGCRKISNETQELIGSPNLGEVKDMSYMFYGSSFNQYIAEWDTSLVQNMSYMFYGASEFSFYIGDWDVSSVTDMSYMFYNAKVFNTYIGDWDVSNVTNMASMFEKALLFDTYLAEWNTQSVTNMDSMFKEAVSYNQPNIAQWNVSNVTNMNAMFKDAISFSNQDLSVWDVGNVTEHNEFLSGAGADNNEPIWP